MSNPALPRSTTLVGTVRAADLATQSKSARAGHLLQVAGEQPYVLRRKDGPSFGDTAFFKPWENTTVQCTGFVQGRLFLLLSICAACA